MTLASFVVHEQGSTQLRSPWGRGAQSGGAMAAQTTTASRQSIRRTLTGTPLCAILPDAQSSSVIPEGAAAAVRSRRGITDRSGGERWHTFKELHLVLRAIMELIFAVSVVMTVFTVVLLPCIILCLGVLLVLGIDDRFVNPVVIYVAFPEAVLIGGYLLLRYWRQISEFVRSISP